MNSIETTFAKLRRQQQKAFIPFLAAGDPDLQFTHDAIMAVAAGGAAICEVGIPYSDPIADGPVIQASYSRALRAGVKLDGVMAMLAKASSSVDIPLVTMVSHSILYRRGVAEYCRLAAASGIAGAIVPDLPADESEDVADCCEKYGLGLCQLVTPTTPDDRARAILQRTSGFVYCVSVTGITGERTQLPSDLVQRVKFLQAETSLPVCVGFGISEIDQAKSVAAVADGIIVGSAFIRRIAAGQSKPRRELLAEITEFTRQMVTAIRAR
jgi:tryptophan synthase alpha chain